MKKETNTRRGGARALLPFLIFIAIYLGAGLCLQAGGTDMAFYQFPSVAAIFAAVVSAFCLFSGPIEEKFAVFARGAGEENMMTMLMIFLLAGAFSRTAGAMGGVDAAVNLGLSLVPVRYVAAGVFVISAFLGVATGTSMGTLGAMVPIALGVAEKAQLSLPLIVAACVGGAMFGDNLSMISDTTIAAARTQRCELRDKFRVNFLIALPAAVLTILLLLLFGAPSAAGALEGLQFQWVRVLPYLLVLALAVAGINVFLVLTIGIFSAGFIGIAYGDLNVLSFAQSIWDGFTGMNEVFFLSLFCGGLAALTTHYGGVAWLLDRVRRLIRGPKSAQAGICALVSLADIAVANNTVAILITGPIARDVCREYKVDPRRSASLLDIFSCVFQGVVPYGAQLLLVGSLTAGALNPLELVPLLWYQQLLALFAVLSILFPFADRICRRDPWNWEYDMPQSSADIRVNTKFPPKSS